MCTSSQMEFNVLNEFHIIFSALIITLENEDRAAIRLTLATVSCMIKLTLQQRNNAIVKSRISRIRHVELNHIAVEKSF